MIRAALATVLLAGVLPAADYQDRFLTVNGIRLHYLDWGGEGKQPFVMLHGISRVAHQFDHLAPFFRDKYRVLAIDMRGHGDSGWSPEGAYLVEDYVKDLEAFVDQLQLRNLVLLGNSTGGRVVQVYAGLHPDRVSRLISEDVGPERPSDIAASFARQVAQEANGWASEAELLAVLRKSNAKTPEPILASYAHYASKVREDGRVVWKRDPNLAKGFVVTELWRYVRDIRCPVIYVLGGASRIVPPATQDVIVLADGDAPGEAAALAAAARWRHEGRRVRIARPPRGADFNDVLLDRSTSSGEQTR